MPCVITDFAYELNSDMDILKLTYDQLLQSLEEQGRSMCDRHTIISHIIDNLTPMENTPWANDYPIISMDNMLKLLRINADYALADSYSCSYDYRTTHFKVSNREFLKAEFYKFANDNSQTMTDINFNEFSVGFEDVVNEEDAETVIDDNSDMESVISLLSLEEPDSEHEEIVQPVQLSSPRSPPMSYITTEQPPLTPLDDDADDVMQFCSPPPLVRSQTMYINGFRFSRQGSATSRVLQFD